MDIKENKMRAREVLKKDLWFFIGVYIAYSLIVSLLSSVVVGILFMGFFAVGYATIQLNALRNDEYKFEQLFPDINKHLLRTCLAGILMNVFIFLWSLLFIIPGIVKSYSYSMTYFIMRDDETIEGSDAITKSKEMMNGHKKELFMQDLSFIGWILLSILTFGILLFWVVPYMNLARAEFYNKLVGRSGVSVEVVEPSGDTQSMTAEF